MGLFNNPFGDEKYQVGEPPRPPDDSAVIISPDTYRENRIPPGQSRTRRWPVLDAYGAPQIDVANWRLELFGAVEKTIAFTWNEFLFALILTGQKTPVITVVMAQFVSEMGLQWNLMSATAVMALVPAFVLTLFGQKYVIRGLKI